MGYFKEGGKLNSGYAEVLKSIGSSDPTPGGGSVAALSLAHAHSLALMVARLTVGEEKGAGGHEAAEQVILDSTDGVNNALRLAHSDAEAFDSVMSAYRMTKDTVDDQYARSLAIREATIGAAKAPLDTAISALSLLSSLEGLCVSCNPNALTDLASAAELCLSSVKIASFNVKINLDFIEGDDVEYISSQLNQVILDSKNSARNINLKVNERLKWI